MSHDQLQLEEWLPQLVDRDREEPPLLGPLAWVQRRCSSRKPPRRFAGSSGQQSLAQHHFLRKAMADRMVLAGTSKTVCLHLKCPAVGLVGFVGSRQLFPPLFLHANH